MICLRVVFFLFGIFYQVFGLNHRELQDGGDIPVAYNKEDSRTYTVIKLGDKYHELTLIDDSILILLPTSMAQKAGKLLKQSDLDFVKANMLNITFDLLLPTSQLEYRGHDLHVLKESKKKLNDKLYCQKLYPNVLSCDSAEPTFTLEGDRISFDSLAYLENLGAPLIIRQVYDPRYILVPDPDHQHLIGAIVGVVERVSKPLSYESIKRKEKMKLIFFWLEMNIMFWMGVPSFLKTCTPFLYPPQDYSKNRMIRDDPLILDLFIMRTTATCMLMAVNMMVVLYQLNPNKYNLKSDCKALFPTGKNKTTVRLLSEDMFITDGCD